MGGVAYEQFWLGGAENAGPAVGGPFTLTDQNGATRSDADFRGKIMLIYFGYTYCPDVCPATLLAITQALDGLGAEADKVSAIWRLRDLARQEGRDPAFWRAGTKLLKVYNDLGLTALPLGPKGTVVPEGSAQARASREYLVCMAERDYPALSEMLERRGGETGRWS